MSNLILLFSCLLLGLLLRRLKGFPKDAHLVLSAFIIYVCLPALTLLYTTELRFESKQMLPISMSYIIYIGSFVFFRILSKFLNIDRGTAGALTLTAGISSISFVGFPIFELLYGHKGLEMGVLMSQAGSIIVCGTLGIMTASYYSATEPSLKKMLKHVFSFPPFLAFVLAIILNISHVHLPLVLSNILQKLGEPFSVIAIISVGLQIQFHDFFQKPLLWGLFYKLILAPAFIYLLFIILLGEKTWLGQISVVGAGLGSMNTATIIAINHKLNPKIASLMIGISIPLSFITVAIINYLLSYIN